MSEALDPATAFDVLVERRGAVLELTFHRPEKRNALTHSMYAKLADALQLANRDPELRAVMLTGFGDAFTAGNDLDDFLRPMPEGTPPVLRFLHALVDFDKPLLAAVNGLAVGIGLTMLLHCDLVFACSTAHFKAPFAEVGLIPEAASSLLLPATVGMAWAADVLLAGRELSATEALKVGLVSRVLPHGMLLPEARHVIDAVAAMPPQAMGRSKKLLRGDRQAVRARIAEEAALFLDQLQSAEFRDTVAAMRARRHAQSS